MPHHRLRRLSVHTSPVLVFYYHSYAHDHHPHPENVRDLIHPHSMKQLYSAFSSYLPSGLSTRYSYLSLPPLDLVSRSRFHVLHTHPRRAAFAAFLLCYLVTCLYFRHVSARDPTSLFFDPRHGFDHIYSKSRLAEAEQYIINATMQTKVRGNSTDTPDMAIGIATVQRRGQRYFRAAMGSLLHGLSDDQRDRFHLMVLIANTDPTTHKAYNETWLHTSTDKILTYTDASPTIRAKAEHLELTDTELRTKQLFDYVYLLKTLYATGAPTIVTFEDDIIAAEGWYPRTLQAMRSLPNTPSTLYLRLFYNSSFLGWNREFWPYYLASSLCIAFVTTLALRLLATRTSTGARLINIRTTIAILLVCTPSLIALWFAAGRLTVHAPQRGIVRMDKYGCCSQALAFPRAQVPGLLAFYEERAIGYVDVLAEEYADRQRLERWAVNPAVVQHIGARSSRGDDESQMRWGRNVAQNIWNFGFETEYTTTP